MRLAPNDREVAGKIIDAEAVIINLTNGVYYSMDGAGAVVWALIGAHRTSSEIIDVLAERYGVDPEEARRDVEHLVAELVAERLVSVDDQDVLSAAAADLSFADGSSYERPVLHKYTDMGDVLSLDPPLPRLEQSTSPGLPKASPETGGEGT